MPSGSEFKQPFDFSFTVVRVQVDVHSVSSLMLYRREVQAYVGAFLVRVTKDNPAAFRGRFRYVVKGILPEGEHLVEVGTIDYY